MNHHPANAAQQTAPCGVDHGVLPNEVGMASMKEAESALFCTLENVSSLSVPFNLTIPVFFDVGCPNCPPVKWMIVWMFFIHRGPYGEPAIEMHMMSHEIVTAAS